MSEQADGIDYVIGRAKRESDRLNSQHRTLVRMFGYALHPSIAETLGPNSQIADIATGTAIWLEEVATQLPPTCTFHGFDISSDQYPPPESLPANLQLHLHNAKEEFPTKWHGAFDAVQVRCIAAGMADEDWKPVFQNLLQLLKPGGALQWIEPDINFFLEPLRGENGLFPSAHDKVSRLVFELSGLSRQGNIGSKVLPGTFSDAGMTGISKGVEGAESVPEMKETVMMNLMAVMTNSLETCIKKGVEGAPTADEAEELREQAVEEVRQGCYYPVPFHMVVGFKPN